MGEQKVGLARGVTQLRGSFVYDRVTLLAGPTLLHIDSQVRTIGTWTSAVGPGNGVNFFIIRIINAF